MNYLNKAKQLKNFLDKFQSIKNSELKNYNFDNIKIVKRKNLALPFIKDILEAQNIKGILRSTLFFDKNTVDTNLYFKVLNSINEEVKKNNSELIFIYLPSWSRYFTKFNKDELIFNKKNEIITFVKNKEIKFIDFENILKMEKNKQKYFPLGFIGHYNKKGYSLIADMIVQEIN